MKTMQFYIAFLCFFLPFNTAFSMDYYVSAKGSGTKNGTSVQNSWEGFSHIKWGTQTGQVGPGSNLYICGEINSNLTVGISGESGNPVLIKGDCPGDPGIIDGANVVGGPWVLVSDNVYSTTVNPGVNGIVTEDDAALVRIPWKGDGTDTVAAMTAFGKGTWSYDRADHILYVLTSAADDPSSHVMEASYGQNYSTQIYLSNRSFVTLENLTIKNAGDYGVLIQTGSNDTITNSLIYNTYNWGIFSKGITNMVVNNNTLHHNVWMIHAPFPSLAGGESIRYYGNTGGSIYNNTISYNCSLGIDLTGGTSGTHVYGNIIHDNLGLTTAYAAGIYSDNAQNNEIYNNLMYNEIVGISNSSETSKGPSSGNHIYNNVIYNYFDDGMYLGAYHSKWVASQGNFIYNNTIVRGPNSKGAALQIGTSENDTFKNNIVVGSVAWYPQDHEILGAFDYNAYFSYFGAVGKGVQSYAQWQAATKGEAHSISASPGPDALAVFIDPKGLDFGLNSASQLVGAGTNFYSTFTTDFKGVARPATGSWSVGAYANQN